MVSEATPSLGLGFPRRSTQGGTSRAPLSVPAAPPQKDKGRGQAGHITSNHEGKAVPVPRFFLGKSTRWPGRQEVPTRKSAPTARQASVFPERPRLCESSARTLVLPDPLCPLRLSLRDPTVFSSASLHVQGQASHYRPLLHTPGGHDCHTPLWLGPHRGGSEFRLWSLSAPQSGHVLPSAKPVSRRNSCWDDPWWP